MEKETIIKLKLENFWCKDWKAKYKIKELKKKAKAVLNFIVIKPGKKDKIRGVLKSQAAIIIKEKIAVK